MQRIFQKQWHGIDFDSFWHGSSKKLAGSDFYRDFYRQFFQTYHAPSDLNPSWLQRQDEIFHTLLTPELLGLPHERVLSVGCGLGILEGKLFSAGHTNVSVYEVSDAPLKWIRQVLPKKQIFLGNFPDCLGAEEKFDCILLSGVEYFFQQPELIDFLKKVRALLKPQGRCLVVSSSVIVQNSGLRNIYKRFREFVALALHKWQIRSLGQFWGYSRTVEEFQSAMLSARFSGVDFAFFPKVGNWDTIWLRGISSC